MTEAAASSPRGAARSLPRDAEDETTDRGASLLVRAYRSFDLLFSVHARVARREAGEDLRRIVTGILLALFAIGLLLVALVLAHAAAVLLVQNRFQWNMSASLGVVAAGDVAIALLLLLVSRARLSTPVLAETRAMVKKAAGVLRG